MEAYERITRHMPPYDPNQNYGFFGYAGAAVDCAIRRQDCAALKRACELGWINPSTPPSGQSLKGITLVQVARELDCQLSAEALLELGFTEK